MWQHTLTQYVHTSCSMPVHRALRNKDILHEVFQQFSLPPWSQYGTRADETYDPLDRTALARLARVCKTFNDVAVPALWKDLPEIRPLFCLLSAWKMVRQGDRAPTWFHPMYDTYVSICAVSGIPRMTDAVFATRCWLVISPIMNGPGSACTLHMSPPSRSPLRWVTSTCPPELQRHGWETPRGRI